MPRHPPNALTTLNRSHCQCSSFSQPFIRTTNRPGYLLQPSLINHAIDVFDPVTLLELRRAALLCQIFKTSFSRSNPVPRGQATVIRSFVRGKAKPFQQQTIQSDKLPTYLQSFPNLRSARPSKGSSGSGSDIRIKSRYLEASRSIFSSQYVQNRQTLIRAMQNFISKEDTNLTINHPYRAIVRRRSFGAPSGAQQTKFATA